MTKFSELTLKPLVRAVFTAVLASGLAACAESDNQTAGPAQDRAQAESDANPGLEGEQASTTARGKNEKAEPMADQTTQGANAGLTWEEVSAIKQNELEDAGWTKDYVFERYDRNDDNRLNEDEYVLFLSGLADETYVQAKPPSESELDTTAGMAARENELRSMTDTREEQMRIYGPNEEPATPEPVSIADVDEAKIKDRDVINNNQENIGEVEDVVIAPDGSISGLVISVGGFWDVGDKEVFVPADELKAYGDRIIWETFDEDRVGDMPEYEAGEYSGLNP